jgi:hypothetical protein
MRRLLVLGLLVGVSCASPEHEERTSVVRTAILGGRPSGDDENAAVYIETVGSGAPLRCSGLMVAPGLAMTARHCLLKRRSENVLCNADGTPVDVTEVVDLTPEPPEAVTVFIGANKSALRSVAVRQVLVDLDFTICRADLAFVVLAEAGLDARIPLRRAPVRVGENIRVTGWGYTSDARDALPLDRSTLDAARVIDIGPGLIPVGMFSIGGNTTCLGDSGAGALIDGAAVGVYSTIQPSPDHCTSPDSKNLFQGVAAQSDLVARAFAAIGETPLYVDAPKPDAGAPELDAGTGDASDRSPPPAPEPSCATTRRSSTTSGGLLGLAIGAFALRRRSHGKLSART